MNDRDKEAPRVFAGLSGASLPCSMDLGHGVTARPIYAHLFAANMMAFQRAEAGKPHPAPWKAARGGFAYDIEIELSVPANISLAGATSAMEVVRLVASLLRMAHYPYLMVPVTSDHPFDAAGAEQTPTLIPFETEPRIFAAPNETTEISEADLQWLKVAWPLVAELVRQAPQLDTALRACDACTVRGRAASALLTAWGALEELFAPARAELRFRVSAHIAAYLELPGPKRLERFKQVAQLYNARSRIAHSAQDADSRELVETFIVLRNSLMKMIDERAVPSQTDLERKLFCGD
ncbi:MAG: hypothetical protein JNM47_08715 [Hyphomonadaceae bacterium]|nr:hypothetical protein [Hyphomonadaceae bacterium]